MPAGERPSATAITERFLIRGEVGAPQFLPWIERHARKLGLSGGVTAAGPGRVDVVLSGEPDLMDAMEVGCSLGPFEVMVTAIERELLPPNG